MREVKFNIVISDITSQYSKIDKEAYLNEGTFPIVDQGKEFIGGYTNDESQINQNDFPVVIFGDHTRIFKYIDFPFTIGADGAKVLKVNEELAYPKYVFYFLKSVRLHNAGYSRHFKFLKEIKIPLQESFSDQIKIATVLSKAEALIKQRKENIDLLDDFLKSIFLKMFGDPVRNEKKNKIVNLGELGNWKSGGTPSRAITKYFDGNIPWLTSGELESMYVGDSKEKITEEAIDNSNASLVEVGSILLGMYDTAALKSSITTKPVSCNQAIAFSKLNSKLCNTIYIYYIIQIGKEHFKRLQRGVRQQNMNLSMIKGIKIMLPPIELQNEFAAIVEKTEALKAAFKSNLNDLENLYGSLSQKAFKGKLDLSNVQIDEEFDNIEGNEPEETDPIKKAEIKKFFEDKLKELEDSDLDTSDKRYGDPFEGININMKSEGELMSIVEQNWQDVKPHKFYGSDESIINWEWLANLIWRRYRGKYFSFEMLMNYVKKAKLTESVNYYSSEELKTNPKLNGEEDVKAFIHSAVTNVLKDKEQMEKTNKFIQLKQFFYDAEKENFQLILHNEDYKLLKKRTAKERSGIYFSIDQEL